jgi:hypothetical protein
MEGDLTTSLNFKLYNTPQCRSGTTFMFQSFDCFPFILLLQYHMQMVQKS